MTLAEPLLTHVSSFIVHVSPGVQDSIYQELTHIPHAEVHGGEPAGKLIVVMESEHEHQILDAINHIQTLDGVISATLVYHHIDDERGYNNGSNPS